MVSVYLSTSGIILVDPLSKDTKFSAHYMSESILQKLNTNVTKSRKSLGISGCFLHIDNAPSHNATVTSKKIQKLGIKRMPHTAYSPDIAPCDFWLFGIVKEKIKGLSFRNEDELIQKISEILNGISSDEISDVYAEWCYRLEWVIKNGGEYYIN